MFDIVRNLAKALDPLIEAASEEPEGSGILRLALEVGCDPAAVSDLSPLVTFANEISRAYASIDAILEDPDVAERILELLPKLQDLLQRLKGLNNIITSIPDLASRLLSYLIVLYFENYYPVLHDLAVLLGVFTYEDVPSPSEGLPYRKREIHWNRISQLLSNPSGVFQEVYGWGGPSFDSSLFLAHLHNFLWSCGIPSSFENDESSPTDSVLKFTYKVDANLALDFEIKKISGTVDQPPGLIVLPSGATNYKRSLSLGNYWQLSLELEAEAKSDYGLSYRPGGRISITSPSQSTDVSLDGTLSLSNTDTSKNKVLIGAPDETRLEGSGLGITATLKANKTGGEVGVEATLSRGQIVVEPGQGDSFLQKILSNDPLVIPFAGTIGWSSRSGLRFKGSAGLESTIPVRKNLGPVRIDSVYVKVGANQDHSLEVVVAAIIGATLGPVQASMERMGVKAILSFPANGGNFGAANLAFGFQPPLGVGLAINSGPVNGGGFLSYDPPNGRYAGILQLQVSDISLKAIGLLDTKLPGGVPGYSLIIIISTEFSPIQLGWGFTLNGVGGLAGIHRTVVVENLQDGLRKHSLDHILFPKNPVADATQIISDLQTIFPPKPNRYVFGPMALIGWGTPTMVEAELGILIDLPDPVRIIILGQIHATIPAKDAPIVELNLDVLGLVDFSKKLLAVDATLHDSNIAGYDASGDMALRLLWGDQPNFALALGGFNPNFTAPQGFPQLRRITLALGSSDNPRVTLQAYLALTSNTVQFGANAEVYAAAGSFNIYGWLGFDALFTFTPFSFRADLSGGVALRHHRDNLASVHLDGHLTGPSPWHVWGKASLSCLLGDISVHFDARFGQAQDVQLPTKDPWPLLESALQDPRNWSSSLPSTVVAVATPSSPPSAASAQASSPPQTPVIQIDPAANLALHQKVLPLDRTLTKFGEAMLAGSNKYTITQLSVNGKTVIIDSVQDFFAPAQFIQMSDSDKLSHSSFESMQSGVKMVDAVDFDETSVMSSTVEYETIIIDPKASTTTSAPSYTPTLDTQLVFHKNSAAAVSALRSFGLRKFSVGGVQKLAVLEEEKYVISSKLDGSVRNDITSPVAKSEAFQILSSYSTAHPTEKATLQVMPVHEATQLQTNPEPLPVLAVHQTGGVP